MDWNYCPYCMTKIEDGGKCPNCNLTDGTYEPNPIHIPPGSVLKERYLIGRVLGEGGFGITYIGRDLQLDMKVAIKEYYPKNNFGISRNTDTGSFKVSAPISAEQNKNYEKGKNKFLDEARIMARLAKEPSIVRVQDFFDLNNTAYIVMEYIDGITLGKYTEQKGGKLAPDELFPMIEPLFKLMQTMHDMHLLHRDISPDNIMIEGGNVKLLDFGCARDIGTKNETLTILLKHGYAPIEQYQQSGQGPWTDVYAFSATIYFCLTGRTPPGALDRVFADDPLIPPSKLGVKLTPAQEKAILHSLVPQQNLRTRSMQEFHAELYSETIQPEIKTGSLDIVCRINGTAKKISAKLTAIFSGEGLNPDGKYGDVALSGGSAELTLSNGEKASLKDIPAGVKYKVVAEKIDGYRLDAMRSEGVIERDAALLATFEFTKTSPEAVKTGTLTLSGKTVSGEPPKEYSFKVTLEGDGLDKNGSFGGVSFTEGTALVTVPIDGKTVLDGIPEGVKYTVESAMDSEFRHAQAKHGSVSGSREIALELKRQKVVSVPEPAVTVSGGDAPSTDEEIPKEPKTDGKKSKKKDGGKGGRKKGHPVVIILIILLVVAVGAGAAIFALSGDGLPKDAEILYEYEATLQKTGNSWDAVLLEADSEQFHSFIDTLVNCGTDNNTYVWATFSEIPSWVTLSYEKVSSMDVTSSDSERLPARLNEGGVYNASTSSAYKTFSYGGFRLYSTELVLRGNFTKDSVKATLRVIRTGEKIAVPDDPEPPEVAHTAYATLHYSDSVDWEAHTLGDPRPVNEGETQELSWNHFYPEYIREATEKSYNANPSWDGAAPFAIDVTVPDEIFSWPGGTMDYGEYSDICKLRIRVNDLTIKSEGFDDIVIAEQVYESELKPLALDGWLNGNNIQINLQQIIRDSLMITAEAYAKEYLPAIQSVSLTLTVESMEKVDVDFSQNTKYTWPDDSAVASGSVDMTGNTESWAEYRMAETIGDEFTEWDGNYTLELYCNERALLINYVNRLSGESVHTESRSASIDLSEYHDILVIFNQFDIGRPVKLFWRVIPNGEAEAPEAGEDVASDAFTITVNYFDTDGKKIAQTYEMQVEKDRPYVINQYDIDGYDFDHVEGDELTGNMDSDKTVSFYYKKKAGPTPLISDAELLIDFGTLYGTDVDPSSSFFSTFGGYPLYAEFDPYSQYFDEIVEAMETDDAKIVISHGRGTNPMLGLLHNGSEYSYKYSTDMTGANGENLTVIDCEHFNSLFNGSYDLYLKDVSAMWIEDAEGGSDFKVDSVQILKTKKGAYSN